jgi:hypothetical protein
MRRFGVGVAGLIAALLLQLVSTASPAAAAGIGLATGQYTSSGSLGHDGAWTVDTFQSLTVAGTIPVGGRTFVGTAQVAGLVAAFGSQWCSPFPWPLDTAISCDGPVEIGPSTISGSGVGGSIGGSCAGSGPTGTVTSDAPLVGVMTLALPLVCSLSIAGGTQQTVTLSLTLLVPEVSIGIGSSNSIPVAGTFTS